ncbi:fatty acid desaturase family protein [Olivibacter sitiensis]|uniref:fatty acid desaturase family protein n=1 Tax=Olivibacter sitiensis TaxID=376470 RepID=UPI00041571AB|nr:acyl-CoA desaturase [Olivibacter sitiensis]
MQSKLKFTNSNRSTFFSTVREKVEAYFTENALHKYGNKAMWAKVILFMSAFVVIYSLILSNPFGNVWALMCLALLLGACNAFIGFNISHDALHGSLSKKPWLNKLLGYTFHLIGANPYIWDKTHNQVHHTYTNIAGHDEDLDAAGLIRLSDDDPYKKIHRFQHLYAFPLYGLASLNWVFRKDYHKFYRNINSRRQKHPKIEYFNLYFFKFLHLFLFLFLPILVLDISWWQVLIGFIAMHATEGLVMGLVFQLAHVVEGTDFPEPTAEGQIENVWAEHQMRTTANFSSSSKLASFFLGGLNRQIEHHLFPKICHIHYPAISKIIKATAQAYQLPYLENRTFFSALLSHYHILKSFSTAS